MTAEKMTVDLSKMHIDEAPFYAEKTSIVPTRPAAICAGFANEIKQLRMNAGLPKKTDSSRPGAGTKQSAI